MAPSTAVVRAGSESAKITPAPTPSSAQIGAKMIKNKPVVAAAVTATVAN
jgi:ABC-type uncharacterized transport system substrate-binding protein